MGTFLGITVVTFILLVCLTNCESLDCSTKGSIPTTSDLVQFCANSFGITEEQFIGDPEVRFYNGSYYMSMTVAFIPSLGVTYSHIMMAAYNNDSQCWDDLMIVTNDTSSQSVERDEVSTFLITPNGDLYLYYNHLLTDAVTTDYIPEAFSIRVKHGNIDANTKRINMNPNEIIFRKDVDQNADFTDVNVLDTSAANTFVLYVAGTESPDFEYTIHPQFVGSTCFPVTEPSVIQDVINSNYYLSLQCLDFSTGPNYEYGIKVIKSDNVYFLQENWSDFILSPHIFCDGNSESDEYEYPGWTAGTFLIHNNDYYLTVSPNGLFTGSPIKGYAGCIFFKFKNGANSLQIALSVNDIVGELSLYQNHLGSCSGGQMYIGLDGVETTTDPLVTYFWQQDYSGFYHIYNTHWSAVNFIDTITASTYSTTSVTVATQSTTDIDNSSGCYTFLRGLTFVLTVTIYL